jgi:hypothetical protein
MKFLTIIKDIILEARHPISKYEVNGQKIQLLYNTHSNISINKSHYGRVEIDDVKYSMEEIMETIVEVCYKILKNGKSQTKDLSILVTDNQIGIDYHFWVGMGKNNVLYLTINTSIYHPRHLPSNKNSAKIIVTRVGDTIVKESIDDGFTSKQIGDIIIYYKIN